MSVGGLGFLFDSPALLLGVLFFMGLQSAVFGPCRYALLPEHLREGELVAGNALVESGGYLAILLGTIFGGLLINLDGGNTMVAGGVLLVAALGIASSRFIPPAPSSNPDMRLTPDPIRPTWSLLQITASYRSLWFAIGGIAWFWTLGALFLSLLPSYTKDLLGGDETLATLFLAMFSVGIGAGSLTTEWLSRPPGGARAGADRRPWAHVVLLRSVGWSGSPGIRPCRDSPSSPQWTSWPRSRDCASRLT